MSQEAIQTWLWLNTSQTFFAFAYVLLYILRPNDARARLITRVITWPVYVPNARTICIVFNGCLWSVLMNLADATLATALFHK